MTDERGEWLLRLNAIAFVDALRAAVLLERLGPRDLAAAPAARWAQAAGIEAPVAERWRRQALEFDADGERRRVAAMGGRVLTRGGADYPELLDQVPDAPLALYALGVLEAKSAVAVVGSRTPTAYGQRMSRHLAGELARRGLAVVSGLARGIDAEEHAAALAAGGAT